MASEVTEMLMGSEVPPRKAFIYKHAEDAELDV
jgi:DNA gyrase subunit B